MTNQIKTWEPLRKWAKAAARGETDKIPYIDIVTLIDENAELRAKVESLAADAERMDWLDQNIFSAPLDDLDKKLHQGSWAWRTFAPEGVQGSARKIIDAAMAKEKA